MKKHFFLLIEPLLVFSVFFLPGYVSQTQPIQPDLFNSVSFNVIYLIYSAPQILFLLYIMLLSQSSGSSDQPGQVFTSGDLLHTPGKKLANYSIRMIKLQDIFIAVPIAAGIYLILMLFSLIAVLLFPEKSSLLSNPVNWSITNPAIIPLVFLTCLFTGYREELFFRSYFLTRFEMAGVSPIPAIAITTLLFSSGHVYQGLPGFIGTLFIGVYFGVLFYIRRNLHIIAIAHGLFNFANLIFTMV